MTSRSEVCKEWRGEELGDCDKPATHFFQVTLASGETRRIYKCARHARRYQAVALA